MPTPSLAVRVDAVGDAPAWFVEARRACLSTWTRVGRRYERRLAMQHLVRSAEDDVLALAARRVVPQERVVQRPLPVDELPRVARAFNGLDAADRAVLRSSARLSPVPGPRAEHAASALVRLMARLRPR